MTEPIIIETWELADRPEGCVLDIAYTPSMCNTPEAIEQFRGTIAEEHNCVLKKLLQRREIWQVG